MEGFPKRESLLFFLNATLPGVTQDEVKNLTAVLRIENNIIF